MKAVVEAPNVAPHPSGTCVVRIDLKDESPILNARFELANPIPLALERLRAPSRNAVGGELALVK